MLHLLHYVPDVYGFCRASNSSCQCEASAVSYGGLQPSLPGSGSACHTALVSGISYEGRCEQRSNMLTHTKHDIGRIQSWLLDCLSPVPATVVMCTHRTFTHFRPAFRCCGTIGTHAVRLLCAVVSTDVSRCCLLQLLHQRWASMVLMFHPVSVHTVLCLLFR